MDFDEPDLEELIQSDLRTEMSRILSQSEVEELEAAASGGGNHADSNKKISIECATSSRSLQQTSKRDMAVKLELKDSSLTEGFMVHGEFDVIDSSLMHEMSQSSQSPRMYPEISGHFACMPSYDFAHDISQYPTEVAEHNDLSSLTWLTTVDVQALQKLTEQGTVIASSVIGGQREPGNPTMLTPAQSAMMAMVTSGIPAGHAHSSAVMRGNEAVSMDNSHQIPQTTAPTQVSVPSTSQMRYTPIQPYLNPENRFPPQQRYQLQTHTGMGSGAHPYPDRNRIGPHRYVSTGMMGHHPYPPPPYAGNPRGGFVHASSMMQSRFHHHHPSQQQKVYPKPVYSYSCLIAMALYNSKTGCLPVSDIYSFMMENYPYFKTAPDGWKNSVRHNLSLNKCFEKVEKPNGSQRKGCLWALNPAKIAKMKEEVQKWKRKDPDSIRRSMSKPEELDRELEEMRRADEEAARRRMLSLSSHGLTTPSMHMQHYQHHHPPGQFRMQYPSLASHLNSPGAGPSSLPTTPQRHPGQHFSPELAQQNFALTLARSASQPTPGTRNPFDLSPLSCSSPHGVQGSSLNLGSNNNNNAFSASASTSQEMVILSPTGGHSTFFASPHSSASSTSSGNSSLLRTFTEVTSSLAEHSSNFTDMDLDADLAVLQESFWEGTLDSQHSTSSDVGETFTDAEEKQDSLSVKQEETTKKSWPVISESHTILPPVLGVLNTKSHQSSPDAQGFNSASQRVDNFSRELTRFANNNAKPVVLL